MGRVLSEGESPHSFPQHLRRQRTLERPRPQGRLLHSAPPPMAHALTTDLYELNMAASYLRRGMTAPATFSLFVRDLPPEWSFLVACGLERCLEALEDFGFTEEELDYLGAEIGYPSDVLEA